MAIKKNQNSASTDNKNLPAKKKWETPTIILLDSDTINVASKTIVQVKESTVQPAGGGFTNVNNTYYIFNKSSAVS